jgi:hypothetical protein
MRKIIALVAALLSFAAFTSVAQANTTDSCVDFGAGQNNCFASTSEQDVDFGTVHVGRYSIGTFTLVCSDHWSTFVKQGRIVKNGTRNFFVEGLFGLRNPDCTLSVHAISVVNNRRASGSVTLIN